MTKDINLDCGHPYGQDGEEAPVASLPLAPVEPTSAGPAWTAGPWLARPDPANGVEWEVVCWSEGEHPEDDPWFVATIHYGADDGDTGANARLISAAPDLACDGRFLAERLRDFASSSEAGREFHGHVAPALARFEAALAKARGQ